MPVPSAPIQKGDGNTGAVAPSAVGVLAILAGCAGGTTPANTPQMHTRQDVALTAMGNGHLIEYFAYNLATAQKPAVLCRATTTTAAAYGAVVHTGVSGTAIPTAGATAPLDDYQVIVLIGAPGTIGVAGITFSYSLDGGVTFSAVQPLGTATTMALNLPASAGGGPSGVSFTLTAAQTFLASDTFSCNVTAAKMTNTDSTAALEAIRVSSLNFEAIYLDEEYVTGEVSLFDQWLAARELEGRFYLGFINTRHKNLPVPSAESEATFAAAMTALSANDTTIRVSVGTDAADVASEVSGLVLPRPTALFAASRSMKVPVGEDPAFVGRGALDGSPAIADSASNPKWHNEFFYPGLDDARFTTLRTFPGRNGIYLNNARVFSTSTSDYQFVQHARIMNAVCTAAFPLLTNELGKAVGKKQPDPVTGKIYIREDDAVAIEQYVTQGVKDSESVNGQVQDVAVTIARDDDIGSNQGATIHATIQVLAFAYIKSIPTLVKFVRTIAIPITQAVAA